MSAARTLYAAARRPALPVLTVKLGGAIFIFVLFPPPTISDLSDRWCRFHERFCSPPKFQGPMQCTPRQLPNAYVAACVMFTVSYVYVLKTLTKRVIC